MRSRTGKALIYALLIAGTVTFLFPLWWMVAVSLMTPEAAQAATVRGGLAALVPTDPQWHNYPDALMQMGSVRWTGFLDALANSVVVTVLATAGTALSSSLVGMAFARMRFRGSRPMFLVMLGTMMLPAQVTMIPLFILFRNLGWIDTFLPLVVPAFFGNAFFIFMYRQFIAQIPEALLEAARLEVLSESCQEHHHKPELRFGDNITQKERFRQGERGTVHSVLHKVGVVIRIARDKDVRLRGPLAAALKMCNDNVQRHLLVTPVIALDCNLVHNFVILGEVHVHDNTLFCRPQLHLVDLFVILTQIVGSNKLRCSFNLLLFMLAAFRRLQTLFEQTAHERLMHGNIPRDSNKTH